MHVGPVIANNTPLVALAWLDRLDLLRTQMAMPAFAHVELRLRPATHIRPMTTL